MGKGGIGTILVNGQKVAEGRIEHTQCCFFSADEGADVGVDEGTPVTEDYKEGNNKFTGTINKVTIDLKEMKAANCRGGDSASCARPTRARRWRTDRALSIRRRTRALSHRGSALCGLEEESRCR